MCNVLPIAKRLAAKRAAADREKQQFRDDLAAAGFDPGMADWVVTWEEDANGNIVQGSSGLIAARKGGGE